MTEPAARLADFLQGPPCMPLWEFTATELATLDRFERAAFAEGPIDSRPWVPELVDADSTGDPDGVGVIADLTDLPEWMLDADLDNATANGQPLAAFVLARIYDTESVLERVAQQRHLHWVEPFTAARATRHCAADRVLLADHLAVHELVGETGPCECHVLRCMAWPNNDHADWRQEWTI